MDFSGLFEMQGMLFTIMILGYIFRKVGMISDSGKALLTDLVLYVTLPASILKSFQIEFSHQILVSCLSVIAVAVGIQIGAWLLGMILYPGFPDAKKCFSMQPSALMREFLAIPLQKEYSEVWDFCMHRFIQFRSVPLCGPSA